MKTLCLNSNLLVFVYAECYFFVFVLDQVCMSCNFVQNSNLQHFHQLWLVPFLLTAILKNSMMCLNIRMHMYMCRGMCHKEQVLIVIITRCACAAEG